MKSKQTKQEKVYLTQHQDIGKKTTYNVVYTNDCTRNKWTNTEVVTHIWITESTGIQMVH